jgi:hypothetical protein
LLRLGTAVAEGVAGVGAGAASVDRLVDSLVSGDVSDGCEEAGCRLAVARREPHPTRRMSAKRQLRIGRRLGEIGRRQKRLMRLRLARE